MSTDTQEREQAAMDAVTERLQAEFAQGRDSAEVTQAIDEAYAKYAKAPIRDFVPILVERRVRQELQTTS